MCVDSFVLVQCLLQTDRFYRVNTKVSIKRSIRHFLFLSHFSCDYVLSPYLYDADSSELINLEIRFILYFFFFFYFLNSILFFNFYKNTVFFVISRNDRGISK